MYPSGQLTLLQARKIVVRRRIAIGRMHCEDYAAEIARPLALIDQGLAMWRKIQPWVKLVSVPAGLLLARTIGRRFGKLRSLLRWAPLVLSVVRNFTKDPESAGARRAA
jgi:hypothetical protein